MSEFGVFEAAAGSISEDQIAKQAAADKLAAAIYDCKDRFGDFIFAAKDAHDFHDRVALCKDDMIKVVEPHLFPRTGTMRRVCNALRDDWKKTAGGYSAPPAVGDLQRLQAEITDYLMATGELDGFDVDSITDELHSGQMPFDMEDPRVLDIFQRHSSRTAADGKAPIMDPKGDFKGYLDSVDRGGPEKVDANVFVGEGESHDLDPAKTLFASNRKADKHNEESEDEYGHRYDTTRVNGTETNSLAIPMRWSDADFRMVPIKGADPIESDYKGKHRAAVRRFASWCQANKIRPGLNALDRFASQLSDADYFTIVTAMQRAAGGDPTLPVSPFGTGTTYESATSSYVDPTAGGLQPVTPGGLPPSPYGAGYTRSSRLHSAGGKHNADEDAPLDDDLLSTRFPHSREDHRRQRENGGDYKPRHSQDGDWLSTQQGINHETRKALEAMDDAEMGSDHPAFRQHGGRIAVNEYDQGYVPGLHNRYPRGLGPIYDVDAFRADNPSWFNQDGTPNPPPGISSNPYSPSATMSAPEAQWSPRSRYPAPDAWTPSANPAHKDLSLDEMASAWPESDLSSARAYQASPGYAELMQARGRMGSRHTAGSHEYGQDANGLPYFIDGPSHSGMYEFYDEEMPMFWKSDSLDGIKEMIDDLPNMRKQHRKMWGSRHTAAPDYLSKADQALTDLLNQRAEEFQQTIAPLQQALQVVQQAEAEQQAANPFNVMPGGSINVMPGAQAPQGDPMGGGGGMPPGGDPMAGGGDPSMGGMDPAMMAAMMGGGDPSMSGGGGMPPEAMQMMGRRRQGGISVFRMPDEGADHLPWYLDRGAKLPEGAHSAQDIPFPDDVKWPMGGYPEAAPFSPEAYEDVLAARARRKQSAIHEADVMAEWDKWIKKRGLPTGSEADYEQFANDTGMGQQAINKLRRNVARRQAAAGKA